MQQQFAGETEKVQIAFHPALGGGDGGATAFAGAEFLHVVRRPPVQEPRAAGPGETEAGTKISIKDAGRFARCGVFGRPVAVVVDDLRAVQLRKVRAGAAVKFVQHQLAHCRLNNVTIPTPCNMESNCLPALL